MKTLTIKERTKHIIVSLSLLTMALVVGACGKDNKVGTTTPATSVAIPVDAYNTYSSTATTMISQYKANYPCNQGARFDLTFNTNQIVNQTSVGTMFTTGRRAGSIAHIYVGVGSYNDLIIVEKLQNNAGFNVVMSMCPFNTLLTAQKTYSSLYVKNGIVLDDNTTSSIGRVDAAYTYLRAEAYGNYQATWVETVFTSLK